MYEVVAYIPPFIKSSSQDIMVKDIIRENRGFKVCMSVHIINRLKCVCSDRYRGKSLLLSEQNTFEKKLG